MAKRPMSVVVAKRPLGAVAAVIAISAIAVAAVAAWADD
jgi:hypothetical protein